MAMTKAQQNAALAEWLKKGSAQTRATQQRLNPTGRKADTSGWTAPPPRRTQAVRTREATTPSPQDRLFGTDEGFAGLRRGVNNVSQWWNNVVTNTQKNREASQAAMAPKGTPDYSKVPEFTWPWEEQNEGTSVKDWWSENVTARQNAIRDAEQAVTPTQADVDAAEEAEAEEAQAERTKINRDKYTSQAKANRVFDREETFTPLSMEEWEGLSPRQKAAVQFNADLIAAVEADRALKGYTPSPEQQKEYDDLLLERFGTTYSAAPDGIEYAPNVAGLLENADYIPSIELGSIDDFLKLDVTITMDEVRRIDENLNAGRITGAGGQTGPAPERTPEQQRLERAQYLARAQQSAFSNLEDKMREGDVVLSNATGISNRQEALRFGATPPVMESLSPEEAERAELYKQTLAAPGADINETIEMMRLDMADLGFSPERQQIMVDRIRGDAERAAAGQAQWYENNAETSWLPPQDVAIALGSLSMGES